MARARFPHRPRCRQGSLRPLLAATTLLAMLTPAALAAAPAEERACRALGEARLDAADLVDPADRSPLVEGWSRCRDLPDRLRGLAPEPLRLTAGRARERLALSAVDLAAHAALARDSGTDPDGTHARATLALVERIARSGDGSTQAPWVVRTAQDALSFLAARDLEPVGGRYASASPLVLALAVEARSGAAAAARTYHFDLSATLAAWRGARAWSDPSERAPIGELLGMLAESGDGFALTARALMLLDAAGSDRAHAAASGLQAPAERGNVVALVRLAELYEHLADPASGRGADVRRSALAAARAGYRSAARRGDLGARHALGRLALAENDVAGALAHFETGHDLGDPAATRALVELLGARGDEAAERAARLTAELAADGHVEGRYLLARRVLGEEGRADVRALTDLERNVAAGHADSMALLGDLLARGRVMRQDLPRAVALWKDAARRTSDTGLVNAVARVLIDNTTPAVHDPEGAADLLLEVLRDGEPARRCARCYASLAEAHLLLGDAAAAKEALRRGLARLDADREPMLRAVVRGEPVPAAPAQSSGPVIAFRSAGGGR